MGVSVRVFIIEEDDTVHKLSHVAFERLTRHLIKMLKRVLKTDADLEFLMKLDATELEMLIASIRDRVENRSGNS